MTIPPLTNLSPAELDALLKSVKLAKKKLERREESTRTIKTIIDLMVANKITVKALYDAGLPIDVTELQQLQRKAKLNEKSSALVFKYVQRVDEQGQKLAVSRYYQLYTGKVPTQSQNKQYLAATAEMGGKVENLEKYLIPAGTKMSDLNVDDRKNLATLFGVKLRKSK